MDRGRPAIHIRTMIVLLTALTITSIIVFIIVYGVDYLLSRNMKLCMEKFVVAGKSAKS